MSDFSPKPEHKFTFGLRIVGNIECDLFGGLVWDAESPDAGGDIVGSIYRCGRIIAREA